jgi:hypothetical protein
MKPQRFFVVADDGGDTPELVGWTNSIEAAREAAETVAAVRSHATILISQGISSVRVETQIKWSDHCATSPASLPQSCG